MSACTTLTSYSLDCRDSIGGISEVYIAAFENKGTPTITSASALISAWTDATGDFYTYQVRPETANATETFQMNDQNGTVFYEQSISFQLSKQNGLRTVTNDILAKGKWLIIYKDRNGKYRLHGYNNGCTMSAGTGETGTAMGDFNGYKFTFIAKEETQAYEVSSSIIDALTV